ncbi:MAG: hypothetical protein LBS68_01930 [Puniceicoccales bacterium]|jgi:hypothetical protein|nr:hypothetical protein [Puniceicoccales bacterium]
MANRIAPAPNRSIGTKICATSLVALISIVTYPIAAIGALFTFPLVPLESFLKIMSGILTFGFLRSFFRAVFPETEKPTDREEKNAGHSNPELVEEIQGTQGQILDGGDPEDSNPQTDPMGPNLIIPQKPKDLQQTKDELRGLLERINISGETTDKFLAADLTIDQLGCVAGFLEYVGVQRFTNFKSAVCPLSKFLIVVANDSSMFDPAFSWLKLASASETFGETNNNCFTRIKEIGSRCKFAAMTDKSANQAIPLENALERIFSDIVNREIEIIRTHSLGLLSNNNLQRRLCNEWILATATICFFAKTFFDINSPMLAEDQIMKVYADILSDLVNNLNSILRSSGYDGQIDFAVILRTHEIDVTTETDTLSRTITKDAFFNQVDRALALSSPAKKQERKIVSMFLPQFFPGISFCGAGAVSTVLRVNLENTGIRLIRQLLSNEDEARATRHLTLWKAYENETKKNPNFEGRTLAFCAIGEQMAELSETYSSPTFSAEILEDDSKERKYVSMTSAGSKTLHQYRAQFFTATKERSLSPPPAETIESAIWCQLHCLITGQLDGHTDNFMVDPESKIVQSIDPGLTFPPFFFGKNKEELLGNVATAIFPRRNERRLEMKRHMRQNDTLRNVVLKLPPMTENMFSVLQKISQPDGDERKKLISTLEKNNMSPREIAATENRLDAIWQQLQESKPFIIENTADLTSLWAQKNSPFTVENCLLRRHWYRRL